MADSTVNVAMATSNYKRLDLGGVRSIGGKGSSCMRKNSSLRYGVAAALCLTVVSVVVSVVCLWKQTKAAAMNDVLRLDVDILNTKIQTFEEELSEEVIPETRENRNSIPESKSYYSMLLSRLRRSNNDHSRQTRRRGTLPKAVHFRLDVPEGSTEYELRWKIWSDTESFLQDCLQLSSDKKSVRINEAGLYLIYAQVQFENARPRNAFAVQVDGDYVMKCFQSLDYFNHTLTPTQNSRMKPCYSASVAVLRRNQAVTLVNLYSSHRIFNDPYANFWGFVKLADNPS